MIDSAGVTKLYEKGSHLRTREEKEGTRKKDSKREREREDERVLHPPVAWIYIICDGVLP